MPIGNLRSLCGVMVVWITSCKIALMNPFILEVPGEFSLAQCLAYLNRSPLELLHQVEAGKVTKWIKTGSEMILFQISDFQGKLQVKILRGEDNEKNNQAVRKYIVEWFDLDKDLAPFYDMARKDALLSGLIKQYYGYRIVGQPDLYESLIWAVLGQQINLSFAYTLKQRFVREFGKKMVFDGKEYYLFPDPEIVAHLRLEELLRLQLSGQKGRYTIGISEAFVSGALSREKLSGLSLNEARDKLIKIKGIGNWTANYVLMKTFRYPNAFPAEDVGLHNAIRIQLQMQSKPTLDEVRKLFLRYKGWEAYATLYLWRTLQED